MKALSALFKLLFTSPETRYIAAAKNLATKAVCTIEFASFKDLERFMEACNASKEYECQPTIELK